MSHGVLVQKKVAAKDIDAFNRSALAGAALDNGNVVTLPTRNTAATRGNEELWDTGQPATGAGLTNLWMVYEPEIVVTVSGSSQYKGIDPDPRNFYTLSGGVCSVFRLQLGDLVLLTADALGGTKSTNGYVVATNGTYELTWAAAAVSGVSLKYIGDEYISIGTGAIGTQRVTAYAFEVVALA